MNDHFHIPVIQGPGKENMTPLDMRVDGPQSRSVHNGEKKVRSDAGTQNSNQNLQLMRLIATTTTHINPNQRGALISHKRTYPDFRRDVSRSCEFWEH